MKKLVASLLVAAQLAVSLPAFGQQPPSVSIPEPPAPVVGEVDVGAAVSPMKKGQVAPFTGVLLSPRATASLVAQFGLLQEQINIETSKARGEEKAHCEFTVKEAKNALETDKKVLQARVDAQQKHLEAVDAQLKKEIESRPNLQLWVGLGTGVGLAAGIGLTVLTAYALNQASK